MGCLQGRLTFLCNPFVHVHMLSIQDKHLWQGGTDMKGALNILVTPQIWSWVHVYCCNTLALLITAFRRSNI